MSHLIHLRLTQAIILIAFAIAVFLTVSVRKEDTRLWSGSTLVVGLGLWLTTLREFMPINVVTYALAHGMIVAGIYGQGLALVSSLPRRRRLILPGVILVLVLAILEALLLWNMHVDHLYLTTSSFAALAAAIAAQRSWRIWKNRHSAGAISIALAFSIILLAQLGRAISIYFFDHDPNILHDDPRELIIATIGVFALTLQQMGFVSLILELEGETRATAISEATREIERRRRSEEINDELRQMLEERAEFLNTLAHEIRQPLNNATAALQSMTHQMTPEKLQRAGRVVDGVVMKLNNVLAAATRLQSGEVHRHSFDLREFAELARLYFPDDARNRMEMTVEGIGPVETDPDLLSLALRNLIDNALNHSPGEATIRVSVRKTEEGLCLMTRNAAPHLEDINTEKLLHEGAIAAGLTPRGKGLGLFIIRRIAELLGGSVHGCHRDGEFCVELRLPA